MTPVIRISDEVFRRLQRLSEPLVDTPNSVIEKLLDRVEAQEVVPPRVGESTPTAAEAGVPGVFLAPSSVENLRVSIERPVLLHDIQSRLDAATLELVRAHLNGASEFNCWAMTASSRGTFDNMRLGDVVLFTPKGTGRFTYRATVSAKFESQRLGDLLWEVIPGKPWSLIYVLEEVRRVDLDKERLVSEFGYDRSFAVYGITRVQPGRVHAAVARRGSLDAVLAAAVSPHTA